MDRRSWLWRRKSSEKTPGDTESTGSISSPSERFSDEQLNSSHNKHSPEITSKSVPNEEPTENIKTLTEKLSAALLNINAKEELVKQHAKVAEEAVTGWEKAEREVSGLKSQLDATIKKNSALEDRVSHLDGALKECVRQLRQAREEQAEVIAKRANEWDSRKSELESQLTELSLQLEAAKSEAAASIDETKKENKFLRLELGALSQKLEVMTLERDFSTKAAESASKQRLEGIKKVAKLEAECRKLRSKSRKEFGCGDSVSDNWSQISVTDVLKISDAELSQSDLRASSSGIILMDDFLEMEMLAALPGKGNGALSQTASKYEDEAMVNRTAYLEDKIEKLEAEKGELQMELSESRQQMKDTKEKLLELESRLSECQAQFKIELRKVQIQLSECQDQLRTSQGKLNAAENELIELQTQLIEREDQFNSSEARLKDAEINLVEMKMQLIEQESKNKASQEQVKVLEAQLMEMQKQLSENQEKVKASEERIKDANNMIVDLQAQLVLSNKLKQDVERELQSKTAEREELESEKSSLMDKIKSLVDEADKERALSAESMAKSQRLEDELSKRDLEIDPHFQLLVSYKAEKKAEQEKGLAMAAGKLADCQKTIASLGKQLKSLVKFDDFLVESDSPLEFPKESSVFFRASELGKVACVDCQ